MEFVLKVYSVTNYADRVNLLIQTQDDDIDYEHRPRRRGRGNPVIDEPAFVPKDSLNCDIGLVDAKDFGFFKPGKFYKITFEEVP